MEFFIRAAREEDAESIVEVLNPIIEVGRYTIMDEPLSVEEQVEFIRSFPRRGVYHVAICKTTRRVLALQDVMPLSTERALEHVGAISTFVSLAAQGRGIGRALTGATLRAAARLGYLKIMATIRGDNPGAISFYVGQGFRIIGTARKHACVRGEYIDEILAEKFIDQHTL